MALPPAYFALPGLAIDFLSIHAKSSFSESWGAKRNRTAFFVYKYAPTGIQFLDLQAELLSAHVAELINSKGCEGRLVTFVVIGQLLSAIVVIVMD